MRHNHDINITRGRIRTQQQIGSKFTPVDQTNIDRVSGFLQSTANLNQVSIGFFFIESLEVLGWSTKGNKTTILNY